MLGGRRCYLEGMRRWLSVAVLGTLFVACDDDQAAPGGGAVDAGGSTGLDGGGLVPPAAKDASSPDAGVIVDASDAAPSDASTEDADATPDAKANAPPIASVTVSPLARVDVGGTLTVSCAASDPDGDVLTYAMTASAGTLTATNLASTTFTAPLVVNTDIEIGCTVTDGHGGTVTASAHVAARLPTSGLLGYWEFLGDVSDSSHFVRNGSAEGAPTYDVDRFGIPGRAIRFATNADRVVVPHDDALNGVSALTVAAWIQPDPASSSRPVVSKNSNSGTNAGAYHLDVLPDSLPVATAGKLGYSQTVGAGVFSVLAGPAKLSTVSFTHVVMVRDAGVVRFYQGGVMTSSATVAAPAATTSPFLIGAGMGSSFRGRIDEVRVYGRVLADFEIAALASDK